VRGLDSIRFVSAMVVALGHYSGPLRELMEVHLPVLRHLFKFNGPAAVIVFFVVSGFCIHFPYRRSEAVMSLGYYYSRRLIRICLPAVAAIGIWTLVGLRMEPPTFNIYWSILCEIVYYLAYPALLFFRRKTSWGWMIGLSSLAAGLLIFLQRDVILGQGGIYPSSVIWTWLLGLPCWLLGCWLAENYNRFPKFGTMAIWTVRIGIWIFMWVTLVLKFQKPGIWTSYPVTLNLFAWAAAGWVGLEISRYLVQKPRGLLEWAGTWTYSLYLMHEVATPLVQWVGVNPGRLSGNFLLILTGLLLSYLFYLMIERPCHQLAVKISNRMKEVER
jgi:peptidoglycan/LPS O-acetylase OafA/YrhL